MKETVLCKFFSLGVKGPQTYIKLILPSPLTPSHQPPPVITSFYGDVNKIETDRIVFRLDTPEEIPGETKHRVEWRGRGPRKT